jgi:protein Mpv17
MDRISFLGFVLIAVITTPPNYIYQHFLENTFPSKIDNVKAKEANEKSRILASERLSIRNTVAKFFLDQSIGAAVNTIIFICLVGILKGKSPHYIRIDIQKVRFRTARI